MRLRVEDSNGKPQNGSSGLSSFPSKFPISILHPAPTCNVSLVCVSPFSYPKDNLCFVTGGSYAGMMDPAYFVGRKAILHWLNDTFQMNLSKIEETASGALILCLAGTRQRVVQLRSTAGAVACAILDAVFPGEVPMSKVRWDAKSPHEFIENYKIIQRVFEKKGID